VCVGWGGLGCLVLAWVLLLLSIGVVSWLVDVARLGDNFHWFFVFECHVFHVDRALAKFVDWLLWGCWPAYCHHCALNAQTAWHGVSSFLGIGRAALLWVGLTFLLQVVPGSFLVGAFLSILLLLSFSGTRLPFVSFHVLFPCFYSPDSLFFSTPVIRPPDLFSF